MERVFLKEKNFSNLNYIYLKRKRKVWNSWNRSTVIGLKLYRESKVLIRTQKGKKWREEEEQRLEQRLDGYIPRYSPNRIGLRQKDLLSRASLDHASLVVIYSVFDSRSVTFKLSTIDISLGKQFQILFQVFSKFINVLINNDRQIRST